MSESEITRIKEAIALEYMVAKWGLTGFAQEQTRHAFVSQRMQRIEDGRKALEAYVGDKAMGMIVEVFEKIPERPTREHILAILRYAFGDTPDTEYMLNDLKQFWFKRDLLYAIFGGQTGRKITNAF